MTKYLLPIFILFVIVLGCIKRVNVYSSFVEGAKGGLKLIIEVFPYIASVLILVELFNASGLSQMVEKMLAPLLASIGIPSELAPLIVIRPLSGNGSIAILKNIIDTYGVDSYIARAGAIMVGASETVFYVSTVYFSTTHVKKLRYAIPIALVSSMVGVVMSCLMARLF